MSKSTKARVWEDGATGWRTNGQGQREVPALRYDNPNRNGGRGNNYVRFDGVDPANPKILIDRKLNVTTKRQQVRKFRDGPLRALEQNREYRLRIEVPTQRAATDARRLVRYATNSDTPHPQIDIVVVPSP